MKDKGVKGKMRKFLSALAVFASLAVGGCETVALGVATPMLVKPKHINLMNTSYAAADTLVVQTQKTFPRERPLVISDIQEIIDMNQKKPIANPALGKVISSQIRARFQQLGYNVIDNNAQYNLKSYGEVSGTYEIVRRDLHITLRMHDRASGRLLGMYDYTLPVTSEVRRHMANNANYLPSLDGSNLPYIGF